MILGLFESTGKYLRSYAVDRINPIRGIRYMENKKWYMLQIVVLGYDPAAT
jgi:hypothetical protein